MILKNVTQLLLLIKFMKPETIEQFRKDFKFVTPNDPSSSLDDAYKSVGSKTTHQPLQFDRGNNSKLHFEVNMKKCKWRK